MDIGQTVITREVGGKSHSVTETPSQKASADIKPLKSWFDERVRMYLDKAGVSPKKRTTPAPTATPAQ